MNAHLQWHRNQDELHLVERSAKFNGNIDCFQWSSMRVKYFSNISIYSTRMWRCDVTYSWNILFTSSYHNICIYLILFGASYVINEYTQPNEIESFEEEREKTVHRQPTYTHAWLTPSVLLNGRKYKFLMLHTETQVHCLSLVFYDAKKKKQQTILKSISRNTFG